MHEMSHLIMSRMILKEVSRCLPVALNPISFALGNMRPDVSIKLRKLAHNFKESYGYIQSEIEALSGTPVWSVTGSNYAMRLGVVCHYICDYFCFVHTPEFTGSLSTHLAYENMLNRHILHTRKRLSRKRHQTASRSALTIPQIDRQLRAMLTNNRRPTEDMISRDFMSALEVCVTTVSSILEHSCVAGIAQLQVASAMG